jgi:MFS family permease
MTKARVLEARKSVFPISLVVTFLAFIDTHLLIPIISLYARSKGAGVGMTGLIVGLYSITNTPANIFFGRAIDKRGYRTPLIIGLMGDALGMFLYSICRTPIHLALVRAFHGMTGGLAGPATMAIAGEHAPEKQKGKTMSLYGISMAVATLIGYGVSGVLASKLGDESVFYLGSAMLLIGAFLAFMMPRANNALGTKTDIPSAEVEKTRSLFRRRGLISSYCSIFAQYFAFGGLVTLLPLYIADLGMEALHVGILLSIFVIAFILLQFPSGHLSDKVGRKIPILAGLCLTTVSLITLPMVDTFTMLAIIMALYGTAYALLFPSISALVVEHSALEERGAATGIFHASLTAGVAIGSPTMGWVAEFTGTASGLSLISIAPVLALFAVLLILRD